MEELRIPGFRIARRIGWGGTGTVYEAVDEALGRTVALKVIPRTEDARRFGREMQALGRLRDPGVATLYGHGETPHWLFFSLEFVEGEPLADVLARRRAAGGAPAADEIRRGEGLALAIARTLVRAHAVGVVHRDLSPSNIVLGASGEPKLVDFGLAQVSGSMTVTATGPVAGTPPYVAPEALLGRGTASDALRDIYSLGVILHEIVTLGHPYPHQNVEELFLRVRTSEPLSARRANPAVSRDLDAVILSAVARHPDDRYPAMAEFASDLEACLEGRRPRVRRTATVGRIRRSLRPYVSILRVAAPTLALAVLLVGGYLYQGGAETRHAIDAVIGQAREALRRGEAEATESLLKAAENLGAGRRLDEPRRALALWKAIQRYGLAAAEKPTGPAAARLHELKKLRDEILRELVEMPRLAEWLGPPKRRQPAGEALRRAPVRRDTSRATQ